MFLESHFCSIITYAHRIYITYVIDILYIYGYIRKTLYIYLRTSLSLYVYICIYLNRFTYTKVRIRYILSK